MYVNRRSNGYLGSKVLLVSTESIILYVGSVDRFMKVMTRLVKDGLFWNINIEGKPGKIK